ncbi:antitoxin [Salmonella enterica]|nr:antitoxin [Salmonella enterica]EAX3609523.1 antitoxin [Salmonella enterica]EGW6283077.1 antitoxin [Salmonella enterica]EGX3935494.1 antitoxin [Salmonella enterica]
MSKSYIVIQQYLWCNENGCEIEYTSDCVEFDKRDKAIKHGFKQQGSDDFNIGAIENGRLVSFDWMDKPVEKSPEILAEIADAIGYKGADQ